MWEIKPDLCACSDLLTHQQTKSWWHNCCLLYFLHVKTQWWILLCALMKIECFFNRTIIWRLRSRLVYCWRQFWAVRCHIKCNSIANVSAWKPKSHPRCWESDVQVYSTHTTDVASLDVLSEWKPPLNLIFNLFLAIKTQPKISHKTAEQHEGIYQLHHIIHLPWPFVYSRLWILVSSRNSTYLIPIRCLNE